jgi:serine/threonine protein kinase
VWALGVTTIELADGGTPWDKIHPIRALFKIQSGDPPNVKDPRAWSKEMVQFISLCCNKDMDDRSSVAELLQLPWIQNAPSGTMKPMIKEFLKRFVCVLCRITFLLFFCARLRAKNGRKEERKRRGN